MRAIWKRPLPCLRCLAYRDAKPELCDMCEPYPDLEVTVHTLGVGRRADKAIVSDQSGKIFNVPLSELTIVEDSQ